MKEEDEWLKRLRTAVEADGRPLRAISKAAGLGENFLSQAFARTKPREMAVGNFLRIIRVLGRERATYVIRGFGIDPNRDELVEQLSGWSQEETEALLTAFETLRRAVVPNREPEVSVRPESGRTDQAT